MKSKSRENNPAIENAVWLGKDIGGMGYEGTALYLILGAVFTDVSVKTQQKT